jgi:hypothetical protein
MDPNRLDLAVINCADPLFLSKVVKGARVLYGSPRRP